MFTAGGLPLHPTHFEYDLKGHYLAMATLGFGVIVARAALKISDRGYVLKTGKVVLEGEGAMLLGHREVRRAYLGKGTQQIWNSLKPEDGKVQLFVDQRRLNNSMMHDHPVCAKIRSRRAWGSARA